MPKTSKSQAFFDVKPEQPNFVTVAGDYALIRVRIEQSPTSPNEHRYNESQTILGLQKLTEFTDRGWVHFSTATYADKRYTTIIYTLRKPTD